jgi:hypothetical protein
MKSQESTEQELVAFGKYSNLWRNLTRSYREGSEFGPIDQLPEQTRSKLFVKSREFKAFDTFSKERAKGMVLFCLVPLPFVAIVMGVFFPKTEQLTSSQLAISSTIMLVYFSTMAVFGWKAGTRWALKKLTSKLPVSSN